MEEEKKEEEKEKKAKTSNEAEEATTVGMFLKYTRMKQKKSIEAVSDALCIRKIYIKALEDDDYETLPPVPYGLGFVRSYASYLGLNSDRIAQFYKQQALPEKEKPAPVVATKHTQASLPSKYQIYIGLLALAALYILWVSFSALTKQKSTIPVGQNNLQLIEVMSSSEGQDVYSPDVAEIEALSGIVSDEKSDSSATSEASQITVIDGDYTENETPKEPENILEIKVKGDSWVELKDKDKVYLSDVYKKGFEYTMPAVDGLILSIGRYYNVDVYINGELTKVATPRKQRKINLDPFFKH